MSLWALGAAAALFGLLGLLGSRFAARLASAADGALFRGVIYTMAGAVALHLVLTVLDFAGVRWSLPVLAVVGAGIAGIAGLLGTNLASSFPRPKTLTPPTPSLPASPPPAGREGAKTEQRPVSVFKLTTPSSPGGLGGRLGEEGRGDEGFLEDRRKRGNLGWGDALALFALAVFAAFAVTGWIAMPDFVYHWGLKGHRFYLAHGVDYPFLAQRWNWAIHPDYPNLVPEMFAVTALLAGSFDVPAMMLETAVIFALFVAACREALRQGGADLFIQQAGTALVALTSAAFGIGYIMAGAADWNIALALAAALPALLRPPDRTGDFQIAVAAAFAAGSKLEGVPLAASLVCVQIVRRLWAERRLNLRAMAATGFLPAAVVLPWLGRTAHHHLSPTFNSGAFEPARAGEVFAGVGEALLNPAWHGFLPAMFLPLLLVFPRRTRAFAAVATLELLFFFYVYFTTPVGDYRYFVLSNFPRLGFQLVPACLAAALVARGATKSKRPAGPESQPAAPGRKSA